MSEPLSLQVSVGVVPLPQIGIIEEVVDNRVRISRGWLHVQACHHVEASLLHDVPIDTRVTLEIEDNSEFSPKLVKRHAATLAP